MSGSDEGSSLKKLWEKLPEGSAFRASIERAMGFLTELTDGEDPRYQAPEKTPAGPTGSDSGDPGPGQNSSAWSR